ncbi:glycosyltransferase family 87 protein [Alicyclobacillus sendaiensis]|uniref:glycosyltransferase family 87 protein n=1 Tax=Alicyclobacillus sendaiensis TaxID=192387 RepID=UPI0007832225|nr:glycosyltransferase family 87 protein [Alicyclobacillus sendaiensis]
MNLHGRTRRYAVRPFALALVLSVIGICVAKEWQGLGRLHFLGYDYAFFYNAFLHVLAGQADWSHLYNPASERAFLMAHGYPMDPHNHYVYPPQFAWMFAWLGLFPFGLSLALWRMLSMTAGMFGVYWTMKTLWPRIGRGHLLLAVAATLTLTPFQLDIAVGNVNTILFALLALAFYAIHRLDKPTVGALALAAAAAIKVTPLALLVAFAIQRRWNVVARSLSILALGLAASFLFLGWESTAAYAAHFLQFGKQSMANGPAPYNQSLLGVLELLWSKGRGGSTPTWLSLLFDAYALALAFVIGAAMRRKPWTPESIRIGLSALLPVAVSPLVEQPHMVLTLPALMASFHLIRRHPVASARRTYAVLLATAYGLQTLPATFLVNHLTRWVPSLYWLHIQMFVSFACILTALLMMARRHASRPAARTATAA